MARILLAEDDDSLRGFLARALERAGFEVRPAPTAKKPCNIWAIPGTCC
jgi:DNA-binding response OmpR family regulator